MKKVTEETVGISRALAAPFEPGEVRWKPQIVSGNRALAIAYIDARAVEARLDEVVGVGGWFDRYKLLPDGTVVCRLSLWLGEGWISKEDVGAPSEQSDEGDRRKAAFSDGLKRAAVKFGIGRYLYRLGGQWVDYDPRKKQILREPALPGGPTPRPPVRQAAPGGPPGGGRGSVGLGPDGLPVGPVEALEGAGFERRMHARDAALAARVGTEPGELLAKITAAGLEAGYTADLKTWPAEGVELAKRITREFKAAAEPRP